MKKLGGAVAATLLLFGIVGVSPAQAADTATVSVLHGVPGATVDVWANGKPLLTNFKPGTLTDPTQLPAGSYDLKVVQAGAGLDAAAVVEAKGVMVPAGANITVVAHLTADGKPALTPFVNSTETIPAGKAKLTVRHVAAAPAVDVRAGGTVAFPGLVNPKEATATLATGTIKADVVLAGTTTVAIGPADVTLAEGTHTIVYAWGSAEQKTLALAVQVVKGLHSNPAGVPAGGDGSAADTGGRMALVFGVALLAAAAVVLRSRTRATERV